MRAHQRAHDAAAGQELGARPDTRAIDRPHRVVALRQRSELHPRFVRMTPEEARSWDNKERWSVVNAQVVGMVQTIWPYARITQCKDIRLLEVNGD
jgi:hypothetical protein